MRTSKRGRYLIENVGPASGDRRTHFWTHGANRRQNLGLVTLGPTRRYPQPIDSKPVCGTPSPCDNLLHVSSGYPFLTSAAESGAGVLKMVEVSRHKSIDMLRTYVRRADLFREHAGAAFL